MNAIGRLRLATLGLLSALLAVPFLAAHIVHCAGGGAEPGRPAGIPADSSCVAENKVLLASIVVDSPGASMTQIPRKRKSAVIAILDALAQLRNLAATM